MIPLLQAQIGKISATCRRFHVKRLDVFGSAAREYDFSDNSDIDFLVEYEPSHSSPSFDDYLRLRDALTDILDRKVDLVTSGSVRNPYIRANIERSRQPLHGA